MTLTPHNLLLILAIVLFLAAGLGVSLGRVSALGLGMACFAGSFLLT